MSLKTTQIQAVGRASTTAAWQLDKAGDPLVGDQVLLQTVVIPRGQETIEFELQGYAVIDPGPLRRPVRIETPVLTAEVSLVD